MQDEFDDIIEHLSYRDSAKARHEMSLLARKYGLGFMFDPGGGCFSCADEKLPLYGFRCRITTCDDILDLDTLRRNIKEFLEKIG